MVVSPCTTFTLPENVASFFLSRISSNWLAPDLDRLVAVLRETLHRIGHARDRALRKGRTGSDHRERKGGGADAMRDPPEPSAAHGKYHRENHFGLPVLAEEDRALAG